MRDFFYSLLHIYFRHSSVAGIGVFATRRLVSGDVIMIEEPVLVTKFGTLETTDQFNRMYADLHRQFKELATSTQVTKLLTMLITGYWYCRGVY